MSQTPNVMVRKETEPSETFTDDRLQTLTFMLLLHKVGLKKPLLNVCLVAAC